MSASRSSRPAPVEKPPYFFAPCTVLTDEPVPGYRRTTASAVVGGTTDSWYLTSRLLEWGVQRGSNIRVVDASGLDAPAVEEGQEVVQLVPFAGLGGIEVRVRAPLRVIRVLREPAVTGYVVAALRGHPERGEEAFLLHREDDALRLEVRTLSQPAFPYSLASNMGRSMQQEFQRRYLRALV